MILLPDDYQALELSVETKRLVRYLERNLDDGHICLLSINPTGRPPAADVAIVTSSCVFMLSIIEGPNTGDQFAKTAELLSKLYRDNVKDLYEKLRRHRCLARNDMLRVKTNWVLAFPRVVRAQAASAAVGSPALQELVEQSLFSDDWEKFRIDVSLVLDWMRLSLNPHVDEPLDTKPEMDALIHALAPEYTIVRYIDPSGRESRDGTRCQITSDDDIAIDIDDYTVRAFRLDRNQINIVNNIRRGHQLILACAGSGKSVLLLSKAFRIASLSPHHRVLLTCFNKNLESYYLWQINVAGLRNDRIMCRTFHSLLAYLVQTNGLQVYSGPKDEEYFDHLFQVARQALDAGRIAERFQAVFIDEIQILRPEWYEFCYDLLDTSGKNSTVFVICGDRSQNVNENIAKGVAPWEKTTRPDMPSYLGRTVAIETNYRNSKPINEWINRFADAARHCFSTFNIAVDNEDELFLRGRAFRDGVPPAVYVINRSREKEYVIRSVLELHEKHGVPFSDIAVIYHNRLYNPLRYFIQKWVMDGLEEAGISYTTLEKSDESWMESYGSRRGVTLLTIESSLGLDFRAVVLCGLLPMGHYAGVRTMDELLKADHDGDVEKKQAFIKCVNQLYTGCTRARDYLHVILTMPADQNIYSCLIVKANDAGGTD